MIQISWLSEKQTIMVLTRHGLDSFLYSPPAVYRTIQIEEGDLIRFKELNVENGTASQGGDQVCEQNESGSDRI